MCAPPEEQRNEVCPRGGKLTGRPANTEVSTLLRESRKQKNAAVKKGKMKNHDRKQYERSCLEQRFRNRPNHS
jgi:hypothetical protein